MPETSAQKPRKRAQSDARPSGGAKVSPKAKRAPKPPKMDGVDIDAVHAPKKTGRPSKYTPELAAEICERLSNGEPLRQICRDGHMPAWTAVYAWSARDDALSERIAHAREMGFDAIAEEALLIADTPVMGQKQVMGDDKTYTTVEDMLGHRKLQIETRLKLLAKWNPKKYGDRVQLAGDKENPLQIDATVQAKTMFDSLLQNLELRKQTE
jgi:hypothetical protein